MLSFMRDQGFEDSVVQETPKPPNGEDHQQQVSSTQNQSEEPIQEPQYLSVATKSKNVRKTTMLLVVLFVIGLLGLWLMIKKSSPQIAAADSGNTEQTQIETAISRLTGAGSEMFNRMDKIVKKFYEFSDVEQVSVYELSKNPFEHHTVLADVKVCSGTTNDIDSDRLRTRNWQLLTICQTDQGYCCMIDDNILYEGDTIRDYKVGQITDTFVRLESEGDEIVLKLSQ